MNFFRLHKMISFSQYIFYNTHQFQVAGWALVNKIILDAVAATETLRQTSAIWSVPDSWNKCHAGVSLWCEMQWIYFFTFGRQMPEGGEDLYKKYAPSFCYVVWSAGGSESILRHQNVTCGWRGEDVHPHTSWSFKQMPAAINLKATFWINSHVQCEFRSKIS